MEKPENSTENVEERILNALEKLDGGTIHDVSNALGIHRITASKYLAVMEAKGIIRCRAIGKGKFYQVFENHEKNKSLVEA